LTQKAREKFLKTELDDYPTWINSVWVNSRGEALDFKEHKYLIDIYNDQHPSIIYMKAAQMGLSERLISEAVWVCDRLNKNVLYTFPTSSQLGDFVQARLEPVFMFSDYLSRITGSLTMEERKDKQIDTSKKIKKVGLKQIGKAFLYLRGSQNQQQIISVDADCIILDERDRFIQEHVPYIDKRTLHSTLKWRREASTPTFPGRNIHKNYLASDQRVWMITCKKCNLEQEIKFFSNIDFKKKIAFCTQCKSKLNRLGMGKWVALKPEHKAVHGYKISGIYNPRRTISDLIESYETAKVSGFSAMQQFYNQVLGTPYEAEGTKVLRTELNACRGDYEFPLPKKPRGCFAGADVGTKIHVVISQPYKKKSKYVWVGTVNNFIGPTDSLESLIKAYDIKVMVVDAKPETRKVRELANLFPNKIYAAYYPTKKFDIKNYYIYDDGKAEVYLDRTISLDYLVSDIHNELVEIPSNAQYIKDFYDQMTSSQRITDVSKRTGQPVARWIEKSPDHYFHAANYDRIASIKGGVGQALLESIKSPTGIKDNPYPETIAGWARWIKIGGKKIF